MGGNRQGNSNRLPYSRRMDIRAVIATKRDGHELSGEQIRGTIRGYVEGAISEVEMAALLMAIYLRGLTNRETAALTLAMADSGERLDLSGIPGVKVDKHSTGGVGDKTTLVVAPLVASYGIPVPKLSGRALGHTGGTIDKLECLPGLSTDLTPDRFREQVAQLGLAIGAQRADLAPADKRMYALRDRIGAVDSVPLIASSVMSKKLAAGADAIVLDVKAGRGAFMPTVRKARVLAAVMVAIGTQAGKQMVALVTRMDNPLGRAVGDALELAEAVETLQGRGPKDFKRLCEIIAGYMLQLGGAASDPRQGRRLAREGLRDERGLVKLRQLVTAQGGDPDALQALPALAGPMQTGEIQAGVTGYIRHIDALLLGQTLRELQTAAGNLKASCGVQLVRGVGEYAVAGDVLAHIMAHRGVESAALQAAKDRLQEAFLMGGKPPSPRPLVAAVITADSVS